MDILFLEHVQKKYRKKTFWGKREKSVLEDLHLTVRHGETVGLLGLNGSGKTTTLKLILGFLKPDRGKVWLFGSEKRCRELLQRVGFLPELPYLTPYLTGSELLSFFYDLSALPKGEKRGQMEKVIEEMGLANFVSQLAGEYSKGMRQRLVLAQALLHNPDFFVLDEPTSGLDARTAKEMAILIFALKREKKTILLSSHHISFVERVCDRAAILAGGRIQKVLKKEEWQGGGGLEPLFLQEVRDSGEVGSIQVEVY